MIDLVFGYMFFVVVTKKVGGCLFEEKKADETNVDQNVRCARRAGVIPFISFSEGGGRGEGEGVVRFSFKHFAFVTPFLKNF